LTHLDGETPANRRTFARPMKWPGFWRFGGNPGEPAGRSGTISPADGL